MKRTVIYTLPFKLAAFILVVVTLVLTVGCVIGAVLLSAGDAYTKTEAEFRDDILWSQSLSQRYAICSIANREDWEMLQDVYGEGNLIWAVYNEAGELLATNCDEQMQQTLRFSDWKYFTRTPYEDVFRSEEEAAYYIRADFREGFPVQDEYALTAYWAELAYSLRFAVFYVGAASMLIAVVLFVLLMVGAGRRNDREELSPGVANRMPFDVLTAAVVGLEGLAVALVVELSYNISTATSDVLVAVILYALAALVMAAVLLGWCMSFSVRLKQGRWWKNTIICSMAVLGWKIVKVVVTWLWKAIKYIAVLGWKIVKVCAIRLWKAVQWLLRGVRSAAVGIRGLVRGIPLVRKTAAVTVSISAVNLFAILVCWRSTALLPIWLIETILLGGGAIYIALILRKLQFGGKALADGDLTYQVDTAGMFWDFKQHGDNLNSIAVGMSLAVEERMKSERLKTELITNVSHDIKTPLTSIINYADLISAEPTENQKITEYCEVLQRQSERLKKLIADLVEASKASTGNLEVNLAPCEVGVLLAQTAGEYEKRLESTGLRLIVRQPEENRLRIMADGRLLWRVFDNLMNNICKYGQPQTRVYLNLEENDGAAVITFKNTSCYELDVSAEELLERFVRADSSRSTEGSGLGLSIAQSLTELQGGTLGISCDADLFKVTLSFPVIP